MSQEEYYKYFSLLRSSQVSAEGFLKLLVEGYGSSVPQESQYIEHVSLKALDKKADKNAQGLAKEIAALTCNERSSSSFIIIGISKEGKPEGGRLTEARKKRLRDILDEHPENFVNPPVSTEWASKALENGGEIVVIRVLGDERPRECVADGKCYMREGAQSTPIGKELARRLIAALEHAEKQRELSKEEIRETTRDAVRETMLELYPDGVTQPLAKAAKKGKVRKAQELAKDERDLSIVRMAQARKAIGQKDLAGAEKFYLESVELARKAKKPDIEATALAELAAKVYAKYGRMDDADKYINQSLEIAAKVKDPPPHPFFYSGNVRYAAGDYDGAIALYGKAIELDRNLAEAYYNRGNANYKKGDYDGAIEDYNQALKINPDYARAYHNRGNAKDEKGDYDGAIEDYNQALKINPDYAGVYYNRGNTKYEKGDYDGAIEDYNQALKINPDDAGAYNNRGNANYKKGDYDGAIEDYNQAVKLNPDYARAYHNRGNAKDDKGDYDGAIADYDEAIRLDPEDAEAYYNRGNAKDDKGDYNGAIADYDEAIRLNPEDAKAYCNRGNAKRNKRDLDGAIADFSEAIRLNDKLPDKGMVAFRNRAQAYLLLEKNEEALRDASEALSLGSTSALSTGLAALFALKRYDDAERLLEKNKERLPNELYTRMREGMERWRVIEVELKGIIGRFGKDERVKGALIYGSAAQLWGTPGRLLSPEVRDMDMIVVVEGFEDREKAMVAVRKLKGKTELPVDISVYDKADWEKLKERDLFTKQEVLPKMKVLYGKV